MITLNNLFTFIIMVEKIKIFVFTSSHGLRRRFFPDKFCALFDESSDFSISLDDISAASGRRLSRRVVEEIKIAATANAPMKQVIVINLRDNDLRHGEKQPEALRRLVTSLLEHCHHIPGCWVVFSSLIPSIGYYTTSKDSFIAFNRVMKEETDNFPASSFCQFSRRLLVNGVLEPTYYSDSIHLSELGAEIVARALHRHLQYLTKDF